MSDWKKALFCCIGIGVFLATFVLGEWHALGIAALLLSIIISEKE